MCQKKLSAWTALSEQVEELLDKGLVDLFKENQDRVSEFSVQENGYYLDFSKQLISKDVFGNLVKLAEQSQLREKINDLLAGKPLNNTEGRAALHSALRLPKDSVLE